MYVEICQIWENQSDLGKGTVEKEVEGIGTCKAGSATNLHGSDRNKVSAYCQFL